MTVVVGRRRLNAFLELVKEHPELGLQFEVSLDRDNNTRVTFGRRRVQQPVQGNRAQRRAAMRQARKHA